MDQSIIRITKELGDIQRGSDLSIAVACRDIDVRRVKALVIGPHETPYEFGFFEFDIHFTQDYPSKSPDVQCTTTNGGRCRFNPNIYSTGKVCLSILGTWRGEAGEQWSSAQGLESILLSIQSLLSANPYENEPGYENAKMERDLVLQAQYVQKIRHETLRISVIQRLEEFLDISPRTKPQKLGKSSKTLLYELDENEESKVLFEPFKDLCKRRFLWYFQSYLDAIEKGKSEVQESEAFTRMPFEGPKVNSMDGKFNYAELERRIRNIKAVIDAEPQAWAQESLSAWAKDSTVAANLRLQYDQVLAFFKSGEMPHHVVLEDGNPFVWTITYFGGYMSKFEGGLIRIRMNFSIRFPEEQPRVKFETQIFHHSVAPDGTICYTPKPMKHEDVRSHIEAIISVLEEDEPAYDPRKIVHPKATKLFWGKNDVDKKAYMRCLRRSVEQSMEDFPE